MRFAFHVICWLTVGLSLTATMLLGFLAASYQASGQGLHPVIAIPACVLTLACGWAAATLADRSEG